MAANPAIEDRVDLKGRTLREHAARGTLINGAFNVLYAGLGMLRQLVIAAFLTASEFGLWGIIFVSVTALIFLLEIGISDKFVQQSERDQEAAFQKAFTINLVWRLAFYFLVLATLPAFAAIYGRWDIIFPGAILALAIIASALQSPLWIFYRQMRFARERTLRAIEPVMGLVLTALLGALGAGIWSLIIGTIAGQYAAGLAALKACPYKIRLRFDRQLFREYFSFSWPIVVVTGSGAAMVQMSAIIGKPALGLAGVGAIGLAASVSRFAQRADQIVSQTLYPAVCAVRDRTDLLFESFVKSNRLALMWGVPFGLALTLFAPDLVHFVFGRKWDFAITLLQIYGGFAAATQIGFNWTSYFLARADTKPLAVSGVLSLAAFVAVTIPLMLTNGLVGYGIGMAAVLFVDLCVRAYFLTRLFSGFAMVRHAMRAITPVVPAVAVVLVVRLVEPAHRTLELAIAELVLYAAITAAATWVAERDLMREVIGYLRGARRAPQPA